MFYEEVGKPPVAGVVSEIERIRVERERRRSAADQARKQRQRALEELEEEASAMERAIRSAHHRNRSEGGTGGPGVGGVRSSRSRSQPRSWSGARPRSASRDGRVGSPGPAATGGGDGTRTPTPRDGRSEVEFRRLIKEFRDGGGVLERPSSAASLSSMGLSPSPTPRAPSPNPLRPGAGVSAPSRLSVYVRKRPLSGDEYRLRMFDVVTVAGDATLVVHEPRVKVDLSKVSQACMCLKRPCAAHHPPPPLSRVQHEKVPAHWPVHAHTGVGGEGLFLVHGAPWVMLVGVGAEG
jgi:hypothetical protein